MNCSDKMWRIDQKYNALCDDLMQKYAIELLEESEKYPKYSANTTVDESRIFVDRIFLRSKAMEKIFTNIKGIARGVKESFIVQHVTMNFYQYDWCINEKLLNSKSYFRPDLYTIIGNRVIIIEIDQNQHKCYNKAKEFDRINEFKKYFFEKSLCIIHFNPDNFVSGDEHYKSCWNINEISNIDDWNFRLKRLEITIKKCVCCKMDDDVKIIYLFYDQTKDTICCDKYEREEKFEDNEKNTVSISQKLLRIYSDE
jgi:hypothetical protein